MTLAYDVRTTRMRYWCGGTEPVSTRLLPSYAGERGDMLVLWTDGVEAAQVTAEEVSEWWGMENLDAGVKRVLNYCRQRGAPDNVSLAAARLR